MNNLYAVQRVYSDDIRHHGIKGQKWGVRRYQNSDGSLTSAGRAQYDEPLTRPEYLRSVGASTTSYKKKSKSSTTDTKVKRPSSRPELSKKEKVKKAGEILTKDVALPKVKKAAKAAAITTAVTAGTYLAFKYRKDPRVLAATSKVVEKIGKQRVDKALQVGNNLVGFGRQMKATPLYRAGKRVAVSTAAGVATYKTAKDIDTKFYDAGVTNKRYLGDRTGDIKVVRRKKRR